MMKTTQKLSFLILLAWILAACGPPNGGKPAELAKLESQRDALNQKIEQLKAEIASERGDGPVRTQPPVHVTAVPVGVGEFKHFIQVQGTVESDNTILVPPQSPGMVKKITVDVGDRVTRGQILVELDASVLESSIAEVENGLELAKTIYERQKRLWDKNIGSEIEFLQAKNNKEGLEKKLETLNEQFNLTKITAPISGTVDEILIKEGEMAVTGMGAIRIVQLSNLKITASLAENYISKVQRGDMVKVQIPVLGREFDQRIQAVSQVIDPDNRTFQIELRVPGREAGLKPNMLAVLVINDYTNSEALVVPKVVVQQTGTEQFLFVAVEIETGWAAQKRVVRVGEDYEDKVEILEGLEAGELVVTFGFQKLGDGQAIVADKGTE